MQIPLQITLRGMETSTALEESIRERAVKLEHVFDRITSCRVAVESAHGVHQYAHPFSVRVDLKVPGDEIVVHKENGEDAYAAVREAFDAARRQLEDYVRQQRSGRHRPAPGA
jgi:ribosomal subunit interface protein